MVMYRLHHGCLHKLGEDLLNYTSRSFCILRGIFCIERGKILCLEWREEYFEKKKKIYIRVGYLYKEEDYLDL